MGRQLFVDSFLLGEGTRGVVTVHHTPTYLDDKNPVLRPDRPWESRGVPYADKAFASAFSGGLWYDPADASYKMWYRCGDAGQCYATSSDGIEWTKPALEGGNGTNIIDHDAIDGATVWLDLRPGTVAARRFVMASVTRANGYRSYTLKYSKDGKVWSMARNATGPIADRSTIFFNPFRSVWVYSIKAMSYPHLGRARKYAEGPDLVEAGAWGPDGPANWTSADVLDPPPGCYSKSVTSTQLYNLDAVAYESVVVGLFTILTGKACGPMCNITGAHCSPYNRTGEWDSVFVGYSRDGFHWSRPVVGGKHAVFLPQSDAPAPPWRWNKANVQSVGGGFLVVDGDPTGLPALRFYVGARTGVDQLAGNASVGVAALRRDGFASVELPATGSAAGTVVTRTLVFAGAHLFVNLGLGGGRGAGAGGSSLTVAVVDPASGTPIAPFTHANCRPRRTDSVRLAVVWGSGAGAADLGAVAGRHVRFEFQLTGR